MKSSRPVSSARAATALLAATLIAGTLQLTADTPAGAEQARPGHARPRTTQLRPTAVTDQRRSPGYRESPQQAASARRSDQRQTSTVAWPSSRSVPVGSHLDRAAAVTVVMPGRSDARRVTATVLGHSKAVAAGIRGVLLEMTTRDGSGVPAGRVAFDYSAYRNAYAPSWAGRLVATGYPACILETPKRTACHTPLRLPSHNDVEAGTLTASFAANRASRSVVALAAGATSSVGAGDFAATPLAQDAWWSGGGSSGDFTWAYPMRTPPANNGPQPKLDLTYSSGSVDGRTASTNNQSSIAGEGFGLNDSYIERDYVACRDDGHSGSDDLCWKTDNATLVLNGNASTLVAKEGGGWRLESDDGSRIRRLSGSNGDASNPDNNHETWELTAGDGTKYYFGLSAIPGTTANSNSVWTVPVSGDDSGDPCYTAGTTFATRFCDQAWRWNLDWVVDTNGNAMAYWYSKEANRYSERGATAVSYIRGGRLVRIDYGLRAAAADNTTPPMRVVYSYDDRCLKSATTCADYTKAAWPDTPYDQICTGSQACNGNTAPTFFTTKRLTTITTKIRADAAYEPVDAWDLSYQFLDGGTTADGILALTSITHSGLVGATSTLAPVDLGYQQLDNRVDTSSDGITALPRYRLRTIDTESGERITVNYSDQQCTASNVPAASAADTNTLRCFPQKWTPPGDSAARTDWFHRYVVTSVTDADTTANNDPVTHDYTYSGGAAWAYNIDKLVPDKYRTWSDWRGYTTVTTEVGRADLTDAQSMTLDTFFRGLDGDKTCSGTRTVFVTDSDGTNVPDSRQYAGLTRETVSYTAAGGTEYSGTITDYDSVLTAGSGLDAARFVHPVATHTRVKLADGSWRRGEVDTVYDPDTGQPTRVSDLGDLAVGDDQTCTATSYADTQTTSGAWFVGFPARVVKSKGACGSDALSPTAASVLADNRTFYDGLANGAIGGAGNVTSTQRLSGYSGTNPSYQITGTMTYDPRGRLRTNTVPTAGSTTRTTTTAYTMSSDGTLVGITVTQDSGGKAFQTISTLAPEWGRPTRIQDPNLKVTDATYDAFGRVTQVWLPNRSKSGGATPNTKYAYSVSDTAPSWVRTSSLNTDGSGYNSSYLFYDALLRPTQTQSPSPSGGRIVTGTMYDGRGLASWASADVYAAGAPSGTFVTYPDGSVPALTLTNYDGLGRATKATLYTYNARRWSTATSYQGSNKTTVTPPAGGISTTTVTDIRGRVTSNMEHGTPNLTTDTTYDLNNNITKIEGPAGTFTRAYDIQGRLQQSTDPDTGSTTYTYYDNDQVETTKDADSRVLFHTYDSLDRPTGLYQATTNDPAHQLLGWTYDSAAKGYVDTVTRYFGGTTGATFKTTTNSYSDLYQPNQTTLTIAAGTQADLVQGLPTSYTRNWVYNADGSTRVNYLPKVAVGLATPILSTEALSYTYDSLGQFKSATGVSGIVQDTTYDAIGNPQQYTLGRGPTTQWWLNYTYDTGTRRLTRALAATSLSSNLISDHHYTYDEAGNTLKDADIGLSDPNTGASTPDVQCYRYDDHARLTDAWTPGTADCTTSPGQAALGGPAAYQQNWTYTNTGLRKTQTSTTTPNTTTTDTYTYSDDQHTDAISQLARVTTGTTPSTHTYDYGYDGTGNTASRPDNYHTADNSQTLTWDAEGHLNTLTRPNGNGSTTYVYDDAGTLLLANSPKARTLYLGDTEVTIKKTSGALTAKRYYATPAGTVAVRSSDTQINYLVPDPHGTAEVSLDGTTHATTYRFLTPYGEQRGTTPAIFPTEHGFLDKPTDTDTGLTSIGARYYDATVGRFISADPLLVLDSAAQQLAYPYANNNPITNSDPTGLEPRVPTNDGCASAFDDCTPEEQQSGGGGESADSGSGYNGTSSSSGSGYYGTDYTTPVYDYGQLADYDYNTGHEDGGPLGSLVSSPFRLVWGYAKTIQAGMTGLASGSSNPSIRGAAIASGDELLGQSLSEVGSAGMETLTLLTGVEGGIALIAARKAAWASTTKWIPRESAAKSVDEAGALVRYDPMAASRNLLGQVGEGYARTPSGYTVSAHAAERIVYGAPGRSPTTLSRVDDILNNPTSTQMRPNGTIRVFQGKDWVAVRDTGPIHIVTVMVR